MTDTKLHTNATSERLGELERENEVLLDALVSLCESITGSTCYDPALYAKAEALRVLAHGMASADN